MMCLNQILEDEQITLMRFAAATDRDEINTHLQELERVERLLKASPYPHRPYSPAGLSGPATKDC